MQTFTPLQYVDIAIANHYGLDRELWQTRLDFTRDNLPEITAGTFDYSQADEPILMQKAVRARHDILARKPIGFPASADATASGLQLLAVLTGCEETARNTNLIYNGKRNCAYVIAVDHMNTLLHSDELTRDLMKKPLMTRFYGSDAAPASLFGKDTPEMKMFNQMLVDKLTGANEAMDDIFSCWQNDTLAHKWTLPDGHTAYCPVTEMVKYRIEVNSQNTSYTFQRKENMVSEYFRSLAANVVHS